jgi:hypothetical protein
MWRANPVSVGSPGDAARAAGSPVHVAVWPGGGHGDVGQWSEKLKDLGSNGPDDTPAEAPAACSMHAQAQKEALGRLERQVHSICRKLVPSWIALASCTDLRVMNPAAKCSVRANPGRRAVHRRNLNNAAMAG